MSSSEPGPRSDFFYFERHSSVYLWSGVDYRNNVVGDLDYLYQFNYATGAWARHQLKGEHPPGVFSGCCARIEHCVYFYGGLNESRDSTGSLYELNLTTLTWQELSPPGPGSPSKKYECRMVHHNNTLVIHGGRIKGGSTNETHIFDIATGTWSSPQVTADVPRLDVRFVFCKVSQNKVVKCGGFDRAIYVLDLSTMHWTKVLQSGPDLGFSPTGTCIGYGSDHAQLLMIGKFGVWLLDVATWELKKLQDTDLLPGCKDLMRSGHSATMLSSTLTLVEILIFGGQTYDYVTLSSTTLLILKINEDDKWWRITDIIKEDKLKERRISYLSDSNNEENESAAEVHHVDEVKVAADKVVEDENQFHKGTSTQEKADSVSIPSQTFQAFSQSSQTSSAQASSSKSIPHNNMDGKKHPEDQLTPDKVNFSSDVTTAILNKQSIRRKVANLLLKGLPGFGKTSLLDRLLNEPFRANLPSTGLCEKVITVEIGLSSTHISVYTGEDNSWKLTSFDQSIVSQLDACKVFISYDTTKKTRQHLQHHEARAAKLDRPMSAIEQHVKEVLHKHNINNIVDLQTKNSLYIRDTGGQVEFQESLTLLIFGPSIFIFVLRTDIDIHTKNIIQYRKSNGEAINKYESSISTMDALIQFLTSVSAIQTSEEGMFQEDGTSMFYKPIVFIVGTHIDKLGSEADSILRNTNKILHEMIFQRNYSSLIRFADFHLNKVMYEVDNTCREDKQCQQLRSDINKFIRDRDEYFVVYPVSYLLFCLELQNINETVLSMDDCKELAAKFYIQETEIPSLLNFLHFRVGIIQHYNVDGISDVVIKEPQVLFNKVTDLILQTFLSSGSVSGEEHQQFMKKGILEASAFKDILSNKDKITADQFLLFLLHLRVAVPFADKDGVLKYIIPSVLNHVEYSPSNTVNTEIPPLVITFRLGHCPQGLLGMLISYLLNPKQNQELTFDLLEDQIYQDQVSLQLSSARDYDKIQIKSHLSHIEVRVSLDNYSSESSELYFPRSTTPEEICSKLRLTLNNCLNHSLKKLHYNVEKVGAMFSLACPLEECGNFHEVKTYQSTCSMHCNVSKRMKIYQSTCYMHCNVSKRTLRLPKYGSFWFSEGSCESSTLQATSEPTTTSNVVSRTNVDSKEGHTQTQHTRSSENSSLRTDQCSIPSGKALAFSLRNLILLKWTDEHGRPQTLRLRDKISSEWRNVGDLLGISSSRMDGIYTKSLGDVRQCCREILLDWINSGSLEYPATWDGLLNLLEDLELNALAKTLKTALS